MTIPKSPILSNMEAIQNLITLNQYLLNKEIERGRKALSIPPEKNGEPQAVSNTTNKKLWECIYS